MKKYFIVILTTLLASCQSKEEEFATIETNNQKEVEIEVDDYEFANRGPWTRTSIFDTDKHISVYWAKGDKIGVYSDNSIASFTTLNIADNARHATFDGGGFALTEGSTYYAFYPYNGAVANKCAIPVNYTGQVQQANKSTSHLSSYDYMFSEAVADENKSAAFHFKHLGSIIKLRFQAPQTEKYTSVSIKSLGTPFITSGTVDLTQENPAIDPASVATSSSMNLTFSYDGVLPDTRTLELTTYFAIAPVNMEGSQLVVTLSTANRSYSTTINGLNFKAGKAYHFNCYFDQGDQNFSIENPYVARYMSHVDYTGAPRTYTRVYDYWKESYMSLRLDFPNAISLGENMYTNLLPNKDYTLTSFLDGESKEVKIHTTGQMRMIMTDGMDNFRDLGGWKTADGHHTKYGLIYRSTEMNTIQNPEKLVTSPHSLSASDYTMLREELGIKAELDLRTTGETPGKYQWRSCLGEDIDFHRSAIDYKKLDKANKPLLKDAFEFVISSVKANKPVIFHCVWGSDRTGLLANLMEGVLGVIPSDIDKDYELTTFSGKGRTRNYTLYTAYADTINSYPGDNLQQRYYNWWLSTGISQESLDEFIALMLE